MTIPVGRVEVERGVRLPVGMQIIGGMGEDGKVLRAGHAWERAIDWKEMR